MTITLNPFNFCKRYNGDIEQMIEDIDRVEETPATRYNRKVEANLRYGPLSGHLYPFQRDFISALMDDDSSLRGRPFTRSPFAVNADMGIAYDPAESMAMPREQQFSRVFRGGDIPKARVVVVSGLGQYGKTAAAVQAAMDLESASLGVIEAKTAKLRDDIDREIESKWIEFVQQPVVEELSKTIDDILKQTIESMFVPGDLLRDEAETPKPGRRLAAAEIAEKHKRNRAPRKGK